VRENASARVSADDVVDFKVRVVGNFIYVKKQSTGRLLQLLKQKNLGLERAESRWGMV
jgi:hypothetical protein